MTEASQIVLLGSQRHEPTVLETLRSLPSVEPGAPVAIVSAGWEGREREHEEFERHIEGRAVNLEVYHRVEEIYTRDPAFRGAVRDRHDRLRALQELYRTRLSHGLDAARELIAREGDESLLGPERDAAIESVRAIDEHHFRRVQEIHAEFDATHDLDSHPLVGRYREQLRQQIGDCSALCVAGGHVAILLNRLRVAGLLEFWDRDRPIVAWGAGAMVLTDRVVLFHDSPPQGAGNAEILEAGLGVARGIVALPHASDRLDLEDSSRVRLFARRFGPAQCIALDPGTRVLWDGTVWRGASNAMQLTTTGELAEVAA